jgi:hypothetical protein
MPDHNFDELLDKQFIQIKKIQNALEPWDSTGDSQKLLNLSRSLYFEVQVYQMLLALSCQSPPRVDIEIDSNFERKFDQKLEAMQKRHEESLEEFDKTWKERKRR